MDWDFLMKYALKDLMNLLTAHIHLILKVVQRARIVHHAHARSYGVPNFIQGSPNRDDIIIGDPGSPIWWGPQKFRYGRMNSRGVDKIDLTCLCEDDGVQRRRTA